MRLAALLPAVAMGAAFLSFLLINGARGRASDSQARPRQDETEVAKPIEVTVETVSCETMNQPIRVTGTLKSNEVVAISTKATGLVKRVHVNEGDRVRRGQLLVEIDDGELTAQRDRTLAAVHAAEARLAQASTVRGIRNTAAETDYRRAEQALVAARTRFSQAKALAKIADTEVDTRVASAQAALQAARERLKVLQDGARRQERASAELAVKRAQVQVNHAKAILDRREQLRREGAIAQEEVDNARQNHEVALAELNTAKQQLDLVVEGPRTEEIRVAEEAVRQAEAALEDAEANRARRQISNEDVEAAEAQVRQAEAALDAARAALAQRQVNEDEIRTARAAVNQARADVRYYNQLISQTRVHSPVNGVVSQRQTHVGESVSQTKSQLMTLVASDALYFEATAPENSLPYLREGQHARITLDALPGKTLPGTLREVIPVAEGNTRAVRLRISIPRPKATTVVVGGFARAVLAGESRAAVLSISRAALVSDEGQTAVFLYQGGRAEWRPVRLGGTTGERLEVLEGLQEGDPVIVAGAEQLTDGQPVTLKTGRSR
ncbi:MAG: efflux RND transporter periplasmic adaptor subunit [Armatimonadetes bacterium]|nr:efflux RND transporter periplasmic adaptor subunit [Armatimonadota bacterium]